MGVLHNVYLKIFWAENTISCAELACPTRYIVVGLAVQFAN